MKTTIRKKALLFCAAFIIGSISAGAQPIRTYAGTGVPAFSGDGGAATTARLNTPQGMAIDATGNIYIADTRNNCIRKITAGIISTIGGTGGVSGYSGDGGPATNAKLFWPTAIALDASGNIFIADASNNAVRKISTAGIISTLAGTGVAGYSADGVPAVSSNLNFPGGVWVDPAGNVYIGDTYNYRVRMVNTSGIISTVAGNGIMGYSGDGMAATSSQLYNTNAVTMDAAGNLFMSDNGNHRIRKVNTAGIISTVAGNGIGGYLTDGVPATSTRINFPVGVKTDAAGNIYFGEDGDARVRKINASGIISTIAGTGIGGYSGDGGAATAAKINSPTDVCLDAIGRIYIVDRLNHAIRMIGTDTTPLFTKGHVQNIIICTTSVATSIDTFLTINDLEVGETETWSLLLAPSHGTATVAYSTLSTGSNITPTGLSYTPTPGYSGTDVFKVIISDGRSSDTTTINVTVGSFPIVITPTGPLTVCAPSSVILSATSASGYTYRWFNSGGLIAGAVSQNYSAAYSDAFSVEITTAAGCIDTSAPLSVTINPAPVASITATGAYSFCANDSLILTAGTAPGYTYQWMNGATPIPGATNFSYTSKTPGTYDYRVRVTNSFGCSDISASGLFNVTVYPLPVPIVTPTGPLTVCAPSSVILSATSAPGYTYRWFNSGGVIAGAVSQNYSAAYSDAFSVEITTAAGCIDTSAPLSVTINPAPVAGITATGAYSFCANDSLILTAGTAPGYTYQWMNGATPIPSATNFSYTAKTPGTYDYRVRVTNSFGCSDITASGLFNVTVYPLPVPIVTPTGPLTVCAPSSVILTATSAPGYTYRWFSSGGVITGAVSQNYSATYSDAFSAEITTTAGCVGISAPISVIINPAPVASISGIGAHSFCADDSLILTAATAPGYTYQWMNGTTPIPGAVNMSYTAKTPGTYDYRLRVTNSFGCTDITASGLFNTTVYPLPVSTVTPAGSLSFCVGGSVLLSTPSISGNSYQWYYGTSKPTMSPLSSAIAATLTASATGYYFVKVTTPFGCVSYDSAVQTNMVAPTVISSATSLNICQGKYVTLSSGVSASLTGVTFQWYLNDVAIPGANAATYNAIAAGRYSCFVNLTIGCSWTTPYATVSVNPLPTPVLTYSGGFLKTSTSYMSYQWYKDSKVMPGATTYRITPVKNGNYSVVVTDTNTCSAGTAIYSIETLKTENILPNKAIFVYPNPAIDKVNISYAENVTIEISNTDGRLLIKKQNTKEADISALSNGIYIITVYDQHNNKLLSEKLSKY